VTIVSAEELSRTLVSRLGATTVQAQHIDAWLQSPPAADAQSVHDRIRQLGFHVAMTTDEIEHTLSMM
jgi:hypothetical protein